MENWRSVTAARIGPSRRDEVERKIMAPLVTLGLSDQDRYQDQAQVIHTFSDGWTMRKLMTRGDMAREGEMMSNCIGESYAGNFPACKRSHGPRARKNKKGRCIDCNDTGLAIFRSDCNGCQEKFYSCSAPSCGNSKTEHNNRCKKNDYYRGNHKTVKVERTKARIKRDENGDCASCGGTGTEMNSWEASSLEPYSRFDAVHSWSGKRLKDNETNEIGNDKNTEGVYYSLRDPNNVPKVSLLVAANLEGKKCSYHFYGENNCHTHGPDGCCKECGGTDRQDDIIKGVTVKELQGRGNLPASEKYMGRVNEFLSILNGKTKPEIVNTTVEPSEQTKTMQQMLEESQKLLKRPMTPKDIEGLRAIISKQTADTIVLQASAPTTCKKCSSNNLNRPKTSDSTGMSLCLDCGEFNEHI